MEKIHFSSMTGFTGRNGTGKCSGIEVFPLETQPDILITPLTSRGELARCDFRIPKCDAHKVAEALIRASQPKTSEFEQ
jgi:hypothetical protein